MHWHYYFLAKIGKYNKSHYISSIFRPVIIEVPHFAALRGKEREIVILRSDNGETWREHTLEATEEAVQEVLQESFDPDGNIMVTYFVALSCMTRYLLCRTESVGGLEHHQNHQDLDHRFPPIFCHHFQDQARGSCDRT